MRSWIAPLMMLPSKSKDMDSNGIDLVSGTKTAAYIAANTEHEPKSTNVPYVVCERSWGVTLAMQKLNIHCVQRLEAIVKLRICFGYRRSVGRSVSFCKITHSTFAGKNKGNRALHEQISFFNPFRVEGAYPSK